FTLFFSCSAPHRYLHSFPTRPSSDLVARVAFDVDGFVRNSFSCEEVPHFLAIACPSDENARRRAVLVKNQGMRRTIDGITAQNEDRKSTRLNSSHVKISYAVFCLKKK